LYFAIPASWVGAGKRSPKPQAAAGLAEHSAATSRAKVGAMIGFVVRISTVRAARSAKEHKGRQGYTVIPKCAHTRVKTAACAALEELAS